MEHRPVRALGDVRVLIEGLLEDDSFPRAGATLAANLALLTPAADDVLAALLTQAGQRGDGDRAIMISQFRAFAGRCRHAGLAAVFLPDDPAIDPVVVPLSAPRCARLTTRNRRTTAPVTSAR